MLETSEIVQLLRKMGHDMRVPLSTVISTSDMLNKGIYDPLTPKQAKAVARLQRNQHRLLAILDDFVTYIKAETGDLPLSWKPFDVNSRLAAWAEPVRLVIEEKGLVFRMVTPEPVPQTLTSDEAMIERIVTALLWNAVTHTTQGVIEIHSQWTTDHWLLTIKDTGSGISEQEMPHLFEPFWRGEMRAQIPTAGAGLGLPMSLAIARRMGGNVSLKETSPQGSSFCVQLPIKGNGAVTEELPQQAPYPGH
jgi:signal transduction histidine kinase